MHIQDKMKLIKFVPHIRDEDLKVPFADKHTMQRFLECEFNRLNALVTNVEGTCDVNLSAPDGITLHIRPVEGMIHSVAFQHTGHFNRCIFTYQLFNSEARLYLPSTSVKEGERYYNLHYRADKHDRSL